MKYSQLHRSISQIKTSHACMLGKWLHIQVHTGELSLDRAVMSRPLSHIPKHTHFCCAHVWKTWYKSIQQTEVSWQVTGTPSVDTGISPAQLLYERPMRTSFNGIKVIPESQEDNWTDTKIFVLWSCTCPPPRSMGWKTFLPDSVTYLHP